MKGGGGFAFAGLWESWTVREGLALTGSLAELAPGDTLETCTILTTEANETVAPVHHRMPRMPVILPPTPRKRSTPGCVEAVGAMTSFLVSNLHSPPRPLPPPVSEAPK